MELTYAGIGSRETPGDILDVMYRLGDFFSRKKFILRSGHAKGADRAFEHGEKYGRKEIFVAAQSPYHPRWYEHAAKFHPAWERCSPWAQDLHARNSGIMLGENLDSPVDFVVCWTKDGKASGGTGQALRIAKEYNIPVYNLYFKDAIKRLEANGLITKDFI